VSRYQKGKTNLDFSEARDSECQWHQLGHMHVCISLQTDNHAITPPLSFLQAASPSCRPTNSVKALKAIELKAIDALYISIKSLKTYYAVKNYNMILYLFVQWCHSMAERWGAGVVVCLERGADLHMAQLVLLPLTVSCFSKI